MTNAPEMVDLSEASIRKHHLSVIDKLRAERDEALNQLSSMTHCTHILEKRVETLEAENKRLVAALVQCREEIDYYIRQEYPGDHPIHERYRKRDFSANPARIALEDKG